MKPMTSTRAYLESTVMTARPEQLQLMLYEGAIRFAQNLRSSLQAGDFEGAYNAYERVSAILNELQNGLRPSANAELCEKYSALYDFVQRRLDDASLKRESVLVDDAITILNHLRQTWILVMEKIRNERIGDFPSQAEPADYAPLAVDA
jgi:flagellar protein FliS